MFPYLSYLSEPRISGAVGPVMRRDPVIIAVALIPSMEFLFQAGPALLRFIQSAPDKTMAWQANWLGTHGIEAGADVFAGISIVASAFGATWVVIRQVNESVRRRKEWEAKQAEKREEWEAEQAGERARYEEYLAEKAADNQLHAQSRGAAIDALMEAAKDFSSEYFQELNELTEEVSRRHEQIVRSPENILMERYNGEAQHMDAFDYIHVDNEKWLTPDFKEVPGYLGRSAAAAKRLARIGRAVEARVLPFFDALKLTDRDLLLFRDTVAEIGRISAQIDELRQISQVWHEYSEKLPEKTKTEGDWSKVSASEGRRAAAEKAALPFIRAIGALGHGNRYAELQIEWHVDSVEGGRKNLIYDHNSEITFLDRFREDWKGGGGASD